MIAPRMSMLKRLLLVVPNVVSYRGFLTELSAALVEQGVEVHCACATDTLWGQDGASTDTAVRLHPIPFPREMSPLAHLKASLELNRLVASLRPDVVHAHFSAAIFTTALARRRHWPATLGTFHGVAFLLLDSAKTLLVKRAEVWSSRRMDEVWVLSDDDLHGLRSAAPGVTIKKQTSYGIGCDLDKFDPANISSAVRQTLRAQLGLTETHRVFIFVGRFVRFKGFDTTVRAFLKLAQEDPTARLLLVGARDALHPTGLDPDEERAARDSSQIIDVGFQEDVQRYLAISHVMVFPSHREGMSVCLMEALAMGVPVITRDARGCRDVVRDKVDGLVLRDDSIDRMVEAMKLLSNDQALHQRMAAQALAGRERFDRRQYVREQIEIYRSHSSVRSRT